MVSDVFGNFLGSSFSVPFLKRLIRDFAFNQKVSEFASLSLAFEWHISLLSTVTVTMFDC
jgi:hypothetical protein